MEKDLKAEYESNAATLAEIIRDQRKHMEALPDCGAEPMCISPVQMISLGVTAAVHPSYPMSLLLTAVGEMRKLEDKVADLEKQLAAAHAELTTWEDASEVLGPVCLPVELT